MMNRASMNCNIASSRPLLRSLINFPPPLRYMNKFEEYLENAEIYYAYHRIQQFVEEPFAPSFGASQMQSIFNASRFAISKLKNRNLFGVNYSAASAFSLSLHWEPPASEAD